MGWYNAPAWNDPLGRLRGKASLVHQPSRTMFACDGLHGAAGYRDIRVRCLYVI